MASTAPDIVPLVPHGWAQTTIRQPTEFEGRGIHGNESVGMVIHPAEADAGIVFLISKRGRIIAEIPAHVENVKNLTLTVTLGDEHGTSVGSVSKILAALYGVGIDNAYIEIDAREVPAMDGSAHAFAVALRELKTELDVPRKFIRVKHEITHQENGTLVVIKPLPANEIRRITSIVTTIEFETPIIGRQTVHLESPREDFVGAFARARAFGFMRDVEWLWKAGLALGGNLDNTVVVGDNRVLNPTGLRFPEEFAMTKAVDALGSCALLGHRLLAHIETTRSGNRNFVHALKGLISDAPGNCVIETAKRPKVRARGQRNEPGR